MKLENQVCSLELAKQLKELEFEQESDFAHIKIERKLNGVSSFRQAIKYWNEMSDEYDDIIESIPAYTVAELGEMLPHRKKWNEDVVGFFSNDFILREYLSVGQYGNAYLLQYRGDNCDVPKMPISDKTEADARAKMLIYLKENKLI